MIGWIPVIGPIVEGLFGWLNKRVDADVEKYKVDGTVDIAAIQASAQIIEATKNDIGVRLARDLVIFPTSVWTALIVWDKIVEIRYPELVWGVKPLVEASGLAFLPYAVICFLLGNAALNKWRR